MSLIKAQRLLEIQENIHVAQAREKDGFSLPDEVERELYRQATGGRAWEAFMFIVCPTLFALLIGVLAIHGLTVIGLVNWLP